MNQITAGGTVGFIPDEQVLEGVIEEINAAWIEGNFTANMTKVEMYHNIGKILKEKVDEGYGITDMVQKIVSDAEGRGQDIGTKNLWDAYSFYVAMPELSKLPDGKNISWQKVKRLIHTGSTEPKIEDEPDFILIARKLYKRFGHDGATDLYRELGEVIAGVEM